MKPDAENLCSMISRNREYTYTPKKSRDTLQNRSDCAWAIGINETLTRNTVSRISNGS